MSGGEQPFQQRVGPVGQRFAERLGLRELVLAEHGAVVLSSDDMGRAMMAPGEPVYQAIVRHFGDNVLQPDGALDRRELSRLAFVEGRVEELNAIVHPAVIAQQKLTVDELARTQPEAIVVVESALIFTTKHGTENQSWRERFDCIVLVTAPLEDKIDRFVKRVKAGRGVIYEDRGTLAADARRRLAVQSTNKQHEPECLLIHNDGGLSELRAQVNALWRTLKRAAGAATHIP